MDPSYLRNATAQEHERVEGTLPLMGERLDKVTYVSFLKAFYGFVKGWETWAARHATGVVSDVVLAELEQRRRSLMLERDLAFFSEPLPEKLYRPGLPQDGAALLGSMYVLEGSTLGGQLIAAHLEKVLHLRRGEGNAFFAGYGDQTGSMWKRFKEILVGIPESDAESVVKAAKQTFLDFGAWMTETPSSFLPVSGVHTQDAHG